MRVSVRALWASIQTLSLLMLLSFGSVSLAQNGANTGTFGGMGFGSGLGGGLGGDPGAGPRGGGGAQADFDTLINLIQQTIEPDSWLQNGGTNTILPYPSGVYVDPKGHMKRIRASEQLRDELFRKTSDLAHPWRTDSKLRTVSLKKLDQALQFSLQTGLSPTAELTKLAGLQKISYVKIDAENEDILIAGPAGDSVPGFELQDLAVVAALIHHNTNPLGCSIEPSNQGLVNAQEMLKGKAVLKQLARSPRQIVERMQDEIGPHKVHVFGMNSNTGTAVALIDADEHMKKVGFGTVKTKLGINSYFDHLDRMGDKVPSQSLIRWWFAYADEPIKISPSGNIFQLPEQCVAVLSEQQWVNRQGRAPTGGNDPAADAFAKGMTAKLDGLRKTHASYSRLSAVFELSLALQLACDQTGQPSLEAWLPNLCFIGKQTPPENPQPKTVEGLTTWHKMKNGTIVAVVSGGVKVDSRSITSQENLEPSKFLASSVVPDLPEEPNVAHAKWWWDGDR